MVRRIVIVPRWSGRPSSDWYPWLRGALAARPEAASVTVEAAAMPHPDEPTVAAWVPAVAKAAGADPAVLAETILIGHSVGCQAIVRYLATLPPGVRVAGLLCVAGWWTVEQPWDSIRPWTTTPAGLERLRTAAAITTVLLSDNDPFTPDWRANQHLWEERLGARVQLVHGAAHFNQPTQPAVLNALMDLLRATQGTPAAPPQP